VKLLVGLGNPGFRYADTRHNAGFWVIDKVAAEHGIAVTRRQHEAMIGSGQIGDAKVVLAKPQTFMNLSGRSAVALARFYKIDPADVLVIYDELELEPGRLRLRGSGSAGGHNGMKSVIGSFTTEDVPRLRVGIGRPPGHVPAADYVLRPPEKSERDVLTEAVGRAAACAATWAEHGLEAAMNEWNG
jgi:PTH1 family peptidyl-tRNA hydrolase